MHFARHARLTLATLLVLATAESLAAQQPVRRPASKAPASRPATPAAPVLPTTGYLQGVVVDSVHGDVLVGALIQVEGTSRIGFSDSLGRFLVDSVPPGSHRVMVDHPLLDTLGIALVAAPLIFEANAVTRTILSVPSSEHLAELFCPAARRALGPGALAGRVREPDSDEAAIGARVSLVWYDPEPVGLPAALRNVAKKSPRVREATVGANGTYRICGLPTKYEGKLQAQRKDGGATAEVPVAQEDGLLTLRSVSVAALPALANGKDSGAVRLAPRGRARVLGRVLNVNGAPVANARVGLMGSSAATLTKANGDFALDSLPSGTQALIVRQLGYRPTEVPVELSLMRPARVTVHLGAYVPELSPVEVVSQREEGLQKVGFLDRKRTGAGGYFLGPEQLERRIATKFTDVLRSTPGIRVSEQNGQATLSATRSNTGGCVTMWVDGAQWQQLDAGDLDTFIRPEEVAAIEVYGGVSVPSQFTTPGQNCTTVVVWTKSRVLRRK